MVLIHAHEINSHEINSHEVNSHQINFLRGQLPPDQLPIKIVNEVHVTVFESMWGQVV